MAKTSIDSLSYWRGIAAVKAEVKKTKDLSNAFVKQPAETLKMLGSDPVVAIDKDKKEVTLSKLLLALDEAHRKPVVDSILVAAEKFEKARTEFEDVVAANIGKAELKPLPDLIVRPTPRPEPIPDLVRPTPRPEPIPDLVKPIPRPEPIPDLVKPIPRPSPIPLEPAPTPIPLITPITVKDEIANLKENLVKLEAIQKSLPAKATKAEKKAAANAVQNAKALLSAAEKSAKSVKTKAKKAVKKATKKKK